MFSMENLLKMVGVSQEQFQQLMSLKTALDKLPKEEQNRIVTNFVNELQEAADKTGDK